MIRTAKVIEVKETADTVSLFDTVTIYNEMVKKEMAVRIVTTLRQDALKGLISKESPVGRPSWAIRRGTGYRSPDQPRAEIHRGDPEDRKGRRRREPGHQQLLRVGKTAEHAGGFHKNRGNENKILRRPPADLRKSY